MFCLFLFTNLKLFLFTHMCTCYFFLLCTDQYAIRFIPRENGVHSIDVRFNGSHVPGSPFKIRVGEPGQVGDPGMVSAFGPGLECGTTGTQHSQ